MAYAPPSIGPAGLTIPSYNDIFNYYLANFAAIYGSTVDLEPASSDYQLLSILALALSDAEQLAQSVYNNQSPNFAIGAGLSSLVKLNGLARAKATASTCLVTLTGTAGTVISNGIIQDVNGNLWNLPASVTLDGTGQAIVVATAQQPGAINITAPDQLNVIVTPTAGWTAVDNGSVGGAVVNFNVDNAGSGYTVGDVVTLIQGVATSAQFKLVVFGGFHVWSLIVPGSGYTTALNVGVTGGTGTGLTFDITAASVAVLGRAVETDAQLRARQAVSTELPSISPVAGTQAAILAVKNVTRASVVDNPTGSTDAFGNPAHSVTAVVEGGAPPDIALAIYLKKTIGCLSNGTTTVTVTDPITGNTEPISFDIVTPVPIFLIVNAHIINGGGALSTAQITQIQKGIAAYLNGLQIGGVISFGELVQAAALAANTNQETPTISIRSPFLFGTSASPATSTDIALNFNQAAQGLADNTHIVVNSV